MTEWPAACSRRYLRSVHVSLRITAETRSQPAVVRIDGELTAEGVSELQKTCEGLEESLVLDLTNLSSVDTAGLEALRDLRDRGALIESASPYVQLLLEPAQTD